MGYRLVEPAEGADVCPPSIVVDTTGGTTSWREVKKALRQWYLDQAKALRDVSERDMFPK